MDAPPVQYVKTSDGYNIAYAVSGRGMPLVLMPPEFSHIELYWTQPTFYLPWLQGLASRFQLIQFDGRGQGMSQRGLHPSLSAGDLCLDLEAVVQHLHPGRFCLMAGQHSVPSAVLYAVAHPENVAALILGSGAVKGAEHPMTALASVVGQDWDSFLLSQLPVGRATDFRASLARLKQTISRDDWLTIASALARSDLSESLPRLAAPALVLHQRDLYPIDASTSLTAAIPNARMVHVDGPPPFGDAEPGLRAIATFVDGLPSSEIAAAAQVSSAPPSIAGLSNREVEVLRLLATGKSNQQIADELVISLNTANRHVSNIYAKTGAANRAEAVGYAHRHGLAGSSTD